ncbi:MAG: NAD-dependent epimerase/dehydratase family protein [Candidatus Thorarchaeota archaeon]
MTRVLITGGCGFIGSNLVEYLLTNTDWEVNVLDNLSNGRLEYISNLNDYNKRVNFIEGNILDLTEVENSIQNCKYVINLAAQTSVVESQKNPIFDEEINVKGLLNLLKASVENKIEKFVQASSAAVLGEQEMPINESKVPNPISPYGVSKLAGEAYCFAFFKCFGLKSIILRFSNVYGPKSDMKSSVIAKFIKQIIDKEIITVFGDGNQTRDYIFVRDLCSGIFNSLKKNSNNFEIFQFGSGIETSVNSLTNFLKKITKKRRIKFPGVTYCNPNPSEIYRSYSDISKVKRILNFNPDFDLEKGIEITIDYFIKTKMKDK